MADLKRIVIGTVARRTLFVTALLLIGPMTVSAFHHFQTPNAPGLKPIAVFAWGLDSIGMVLAIWLVARTGIWRTWNGWLRISCYVVSYTYGRMLFSATQDWLTTSGASFRFPGSKHDDYARPALDLLNLLILVWLLTPVVVLTKSVLSTTQEVPRQVNRFSISGLLMYTTIAAFSFVWLRFLTSNLAPKTYCSYLSYSDAVREWFGGVLLFEVPHLIAAMVILYGLSKRWWFVVLTLSGALVLDAFGAKIVASVVEYVSGKQHGGILGGSDMERWSYVCGRSITVYVSFLAAKTLGVQPKFGSDESKNRATEPVED